VFCACTVRYIRGFIKSYDTLVTILKTYLHAFFMVEKAVHLGVRKKGSKKEHSK